jgi:hypothetical protein
MPLEAESTQGHSAAERIRTIEKTSDLIENRNLPACSRILQPTTLLHSAQGPNNNNNNNNNAAVVEKYLSYNQ